MIKIKQLVYLLALVKFILPFVLQHPYYEPHRDELLYLAEGRHLAWGYMEVPPLLSVFAWLAQACGNGMFWIKCWPSLFGALTFMIVAQTILLLGGRWFAILLGFLPFITGAYLRVHFLFQPNFLEIFFWTLMAWSMIAFMQSGRSRWLYVFGISTGLGMMSKYSVALYALAMVLGLLLSPQRKILLNRHLYAAALLALLIFLPNLAWQYRHHFPVVFHMRELQNTQLQYVSPFSFLADQLLMHLPCLLIWLAGLGFVLFSRRGTPYRYNGYAYLLVIALLLLAHGKNYYTLGAYPVLFAFGACWLEQLTRSRFAPARWALVLVSLCLGCLFAFIALPVFEPPALEAWYIKRGMQNSGALQWEDRRLHPLPQDFADMLGWEEMAQKTASAYQRLSSDEKKRTILFCDNYGQAGALNYYGPRYHMPAAFSDAASFLYWIPEGLNFDNLVLLTDDRQEMQHPFIKNFAAAILQDSITSKYAREKGDLVIILKGADTSFKKYFREKIALARARAKW